MRFARRPKIEGFHWTDRKLALYLRKQERVEKKLQKLYPLFADQIEVPVLSVEDEAQRRDRLSRNAEQAYRDLEAQFWRKGRREYFACPPALRAVIRAAWKGWTGPATALYFIYVVKSHNGVQEARRQAHLARERAFRERVFNEMKLTPCLDL